MKFLFIFTLLYHIVLYYVNRTNCNIVKNDYIISQTIQKATYHPPIKTMTDQYVSAFITDPIADSPIALDMKTIKETDEEETVEKNTEEETVEKNTGEETDEEDIDENKTKKITADDWYILALKMSKERKYYDEKIHCLISDWVSEKLKSVYKKFQNYRISETYLFFKFPVNSRVKPNTYVRNILLLINLSSYDKDKVIKEVAVTARSLVPEYFDIIPKYNVNGWDVELKFKFNMKKFQEFNEKFLRDNE